MNISALLQLGGIGSDGLCEGEGEGGGRIGGNRLINELNIDKIVVFDDFSRTTCDTVSKGSVDLFPKNTPKGGYKTKLYCDDF